MDNDHSTNPHILCLVPEPCISPILSGNPSQSCSFGVTCSLMPTGLYIARPLTGVNVICRHIGLLVEGRICGLVQRSLAALHYSGCVPNPPTY